MWVLEVKICVLHYYHKDRLIERCYKTRICKVKRKNAKEIVRIHCFGAVAGHIGLLVVSATWNFAQIQTSLEPNSHSSQCLCWQLAGLRIGLTPFCTFFFLVFLK